MRKIICAVILFGLLLSIVGSVNAESIGDRLKPGQSLYRDQWLESPNHQYVLYMQADGNLVLYKADHWTPIWSTNTWGLPYTRATMTTEGIFKLEQNGGTTVQITPCTWVGGGTYCYPNSYMQLQDDGNLVQYLAPWAIR